MRSLTPLNRPTKLGRPAPALTVAAVLAALVAGCGSSKPPSTGTQQASTTPGAAAFAFARCMRAHGVTGFPDPQVSTTGGSGSIRQAAPASDVASPQFKSAQKACAGIAPGPGNATRDNQQPAPQVLLAFAHCLRGHGFADFPDPDRNGHLSIQTITAAGVDYRSPEFLTAAKACLGVTHGAITPGQVGALVNGSH
jgi:hypothetical protein